MLLLKNRLQFIITLIFIGLVIWWLSFQNVVSKQGISIQWFESGLYGGMALIGGIIGLISAKKWGGFRSTLGRALSLFSIGLLAQEAGQLIYTYYVYVDKIQIPYPSWGDAAYFGSTLLYIAGAIYLAKAAGVRTSLKSGGYKTVVLILPIILLAMSYHVLLHNYHAVSGHPLTVFLDNGYPIGEALYISIALVAYLLSIKLLGGLMKSGILLLILALLIQYVADFTFVYQSNKGTYIAGDYDDLFYLIAYYVMSIALLRFLISFKQLNSSKRQEQTNG